MKTVFVHFVVNHTAKEESKYRVSWTYKIADLDMSTGNSDSADGFVVWLARMSMKYKVEIEGIG